VSAQKALARPRRSLPGRQPATPGSPAPARPGHHHRHRVELLRAKRRSSNGSGAPTRYPANAAAPAHRRLPGRAVLPGHPPRRTLPLHRDPDLREFGQHPATTPSRRPLVSPAPYSTVTKYASTVTKYRPGAAMPGLTADPFDPPKRPWTMLPRRTATVAHGGPAVTGATLAADRRHCDAPQVAVVTQLVYTTTSRAPPIAKRSAGEVGRLVGSAPSRGGSCAGRRVHPNQDCLETTHPEVFRTAMRGTTPCLTNPCIDRPADPRRRLVRSSRLTPLSHWEAHG